jgi:hypothetical protein
MFSGRDNWPGGGPAGRWLFFSLKQEAFVELLEAKFAGRSLSPSPALMR